MHKPFDEMQYTRKPPTKEAELELRKRWAGEEDKRKQESLNRCVLRLYLRNPMYPPVSLWYFLRIIFNFYLV